MKFTSVLVILPFLAQQAFVTSARPHGREENGVNERGFKNERVHNNERGNNNNRGFQGQFSGNQRGGKGRKGGAANKGTTTTAAAAATTTSVASTSDTATTTSDTATTTTDTAAAGNTGIATAATGSGSNNNNNNNNGGGGGNEQTSLTLDPALIGANLAQNGISAASEPGQVASLTSTNNYINFCASPAVGGQPVTNGLQQIGGSCNPVPMGQIPAKSAIPSCKFTFPPNFGTIAANKNFTITLAQKNIITGNFVNATDNYYSAPQQLGAGGVIIGHNHIVVELLSSISQTTPTDPTVFKFFKGLDEAAVNGVLSATVNGGLPAGAYRCCSISTSANHVPVLAPVAQHGTMDDCIYFTTK